MAKVGSDKNARSSAPQDNIRGGLVLSSSVLDLESKRGYRKEVDAIIQQVDGPYASPRILSIQGDDTRVRGALEISARVSLKI